MTFRVRYTAFRVSHATRSSTSAFDQDGNIRPLPQAVSEGLKYRALTCEGAWPMSSKVLAREDAFAGTLASVRMQAVRMQMTEDGWLLLAREHAFAG